jgi:hypothetical protein
MQASLFAPETHARRPREQTEGLEQGLSFDDESQKHGAMPCRQTAATKHQEKRSSIEMYAWFHELRLGSERFGVRLH